MGQLQQLSQLRQLPHIGRPIRYRSTLRTLPSQFTGLLSWHDPADTAKLKANANGTGASPAVTNDAVKYAVNQVSGGPLATDSVGVLWSSNGLNGHPAFKCVAANVNRLITDNFFTAGHDQNFTIAFNMLSTVSTSSPVLVSNTSGFVWAQEGINGRQIIASHGGLKLYAVGDAPAPGVAQTFVITYDGAKFTGRATQPKFHRDLVSGALWSPGYTAATGASGLSGTGLVYGAYSSTPTLPATCMLGDICAWDHAMVSSEEAEMVEMMSGRCLAANSMLDFTGDSHFDGIPIGGATTEDTQNTAANNIVEMVYADLAASLPTMTFNRLRDCYPGRKMSDCFTEYPTWIAPYVYRHQNARHLSFITFSRNDLVLGGGVDGAIANKRILCNQLRSYNLTPVLVMPLPSTFSGYEALRQDEIAKIVAAQASANPIAYGVVRSDLDPIMGPVAAAADATLVSDGDHPTVLGNYYRKVWISGFAQAFYSTTALANCTEIITNNSHVVSLVFDRNTTLLSQPNPTDIIIDGNNCVSAAQGGPPYVIDVTFGVNIPATKRWQINVAGWSSPSAQISTGITST